MKIFLCIAVYAIVALSVESTRYKIPIKKGESDVDRQIKNLKGKKMAHILFENIFFKEYQPEPLKNSQNTAYYGEVEVGTPGQSFSVLFDTGSADFWVPSSKSQQQVCGYHKCFNDRKSSTYKKNGRKIALQYGTGKMSGYLSQDVLKIGDLKIQKQIFGEATQEDSFLSDKNKPFDGILGLGFPALSQSTLSPFFQAKNDKLFEKNVFSVFLDKDHVDGSSIMFGGWDTDIIDESQIKWIPISQAAYWQFTMDSIKVGDSAVAGQYAEAIADTGTSLIAGPQRDVEAIAEALGATKYQGFYVIDNSYTDDLPDITISINGNRFTLEPSDYLLPAGPGEDISLIGFLPFNSDLWILGDVFLNKYYSIYDADNESVGFAPLKNSQYEDY